MDSFPSTRHIHWSAPIFEQRVRCLLTSRCDRLIPHTVLSLDNLLRDFDMFNFEGNYGDFFYCI